MLLVSLRLRESPFSVKIFYAVTESHVVWWNSKTEIDPRTWLKHHLFSRHWTHRVNDFINSPFARLNRRKRDENPIWNRIQKENWYLWLNYLRTTIEYEPFEGMTELPLTNMRRDDAGMTRKYRYPTFWWQISQRYGLKNVWNFSLTNRPRKMKQWFWAIGSGVHWYKGRWHWMRYISPTDLWN